MNNRRLIDLIRYEGRKRPEIAALLARAVDLTDEEIDEAKVPLPWFRKGLKEARTFAIRERMAGRITEWAEFSFSPEQNGFLAYWIGQDCHIKTDREATIMVVSGEPLFFPAGGGVWIDTLFSQTIDPRLTPGGIECSREYYREVHRDWVVRRHA